MWITVDEKMLFAEALRVFHMRKSHSFPLDSAFCHLLLKVIPNGDCGWKVPQGDNFFGEKSVDNGENLSTLHCECGDKRVFRHKRTGPCVQNGEKTGKDIEMLIKRAAAAAWKRREASGQLRIRKKKESAEKRRRSNGNLSV